MDIKNWKENLRELYLHTTPWDGYETRSITFNWGKFKIESKGKMEFYLATKESVEEFIDQLLQESMREKEEGFVTRLELAIEYGSGDALVLENHIRNLIDEYSPQENNLWI